MPLPQGSPNPVEGPGDYTMTKIVHNDTYPAIDPTKADLSGKSVFISGASRGIGRSIAISFAKAGASKIAIGARSDLSGTEKDIREAAIHAGRPEPEVLKLKLDVASKQSIQEAAKAISSAFSGKLDILVNNAAILAGIYKIGDSDPDRWWDTLTANVYGPYLISRALLPIIPSGGVIFNIASVGAHLVTPMASAYQISKFALIRLTEFLAVEYPDVTSISIHPGNTFTDMVAQLPDSSPEFLSVFTESKEISADSLVFLASRDVQWLSGRYINVTWDLPELVGGAKKREIVEGGKLKMKLVV